MRQLIFTSASVGLARGRSGFCTVARSGSLRERTVEELEKMSGREPWDGARRPAVFQFRVHSGGNETLYILSRTCGAGTDFCGRANHVAHHLIFGEDEISALPPPAEVALRFRGWCGKFSGEPHFLPESGRLPPEILLRDGEKLLPAKRWAALTGDAGNAALLCPHGDARATIFIGDESMTETVLGLFAESAAVLGRRNAWEIAFSTGICSRESAGRFLWRMVGERELEVRRPGDFILDFLAPLSVLHAPNTEFAAYARTGTPPSDASRPHHGRSGVSPLSPAAGTPEPESVPAAASRPEDSRRENAPSEAPDKHFSDIAGTAKFLGISAVVFVVVMMIVLFLTPASSGRRTAAVPASAPEAAGDSDVAADASADGASEASVAAFCGFLEEQISRGDFAGAAETWLVFADAFPRQAEARRQNFVPRFKLKIAGAYAEKFSERLRLLDMGGKFSEEERNLLAAELALFRRVCREFELTAGRIQKKNLAVIERAQAVADGVSEPAEDSRER